MTLQIVRDWLLKFNAAGPNGLIARKAPGQPKRDQHFTVNLRPLEKLASATSSAALRNPKR